MLSRNCSLLFNQLLLFEVVVFAPESALQRRAANSLQVVNTWNHSLQLRLYPLVAVQVALVQLLFVTGHRSEVHPLVSLPAHLVVQEVFVLILFGLLFRLFPFFEELIELLSSPLFESFKVFIEEHHS